MQKEQSRDGTAPSRAGAGCCSQLLRTNSQETAAPHLRRFHFALLENLPLDTKSPLSWSHHTRLTGGEEPATLTGAGLGIPDWAQGLFSDGTESFPRHLQVSFSPGVSHTTPIYDGGQRDRARAEAPHQHPFKPANRTGHSWPPPESSRLRPGLRGPATPCSPSWMLPSLWLHPTHGSCSSPQTEPAWQPLSSLRPLPGTGVTAMRAWRQNGLLHPRARPRTCLALDEFPQQERVLLCLHSGPALGPRCA